MADFETSTTVDAPARTVFEYLGNVENMPKYFARMTSAVQGDGEEVRTTAKMPDGTEVQGDAWFRADADAQTLEWGSEGPSSYSGRLEVSGGGRSATITVSLHTTRVEDGDAQVQQGLEETVANVKRLVEG